MTLWLNAYWQEVRAQGTLVGLAGAFVLTLLLVVALVAPFGGYPVGADVDLALAGAGPSLALPLGADHLGRNVAWRLVLASGAFVGPGLLACLVAATLSVGPGALAGQLGGGFASALRFVSGVLASLPRFVLVLLLLTVYGNEPWVLGAAIGLAYVPELTEAVRGRVQELAGADFIEASRGHGVPPGRLLWLHLVVGACTGLIARHLVRVFAFTVGVESTLAYIGGLGVQEPSPSWGNMLVFEWGRGLGVQVLAPGIALYVTVAACAAAATWLGGRRHAG